MHWLRQASIVVRIRSRGDIVQDLVVAGISGLADLLVDGGLGNEAKDSEGVAGVMESIGKGGLGLAARVQGHRLCGGRIGRGTEVSRDLTPCSFSRSSDESGVGLLRFRGCERRTLPALAQEHF
ncbi:hypothetical protein NL676_036285 [Syzygium grande]|nr:hypothetical protein NL676_036285 [Syzygium grande]